MKNPNPSGVKLTAIMSESVGCNSTVTVDKKPVTDGGNSTVTENNKPGDQPTHINLKVNGEDGREVLFRIKRNTPLRKLVKAYCDSRGADIYSFVFLIDGQRLRGELTPDQLEMEDGDEIDVMPPADGGWHGTVMRMM